MIAQTTEKPFSPPCQQPLVFSRANDADCVEIASLFQLVYGDSSHPEIQPGALRKNLLDKNNYWLVCRHEGEIIGTAACIYNAWNQSYELGRAVTTAQWRGHGIAQQLVQRCCDWLAIHCPNSVVVGYPRAKRILDICQQLQTPFTTCGHDGGVQVANGEYEYHLIIFLQAPDLLTNSKIAFDSSLDSDLPPLVGPEGNQQWSSHQFNASLAWNTTDHRDLFIHHAEGDVSDSHGMDQLVTYLREDFATMNSISITVPEARADIIMAAIRNSFRVTAWLPGWYLSGAQRHNCFRLVRRFGSSQPHTHGMESIIDRFDELFCQIKRSAVGGVA